ncbi:MAG: PAS domain-containing protein [Tolypothrix carrinoi HA7290-LM1]|jgi:PAS domain S-box-containing protein|nr:PAS domain-containing protein [Tolypothrix carrinoi HA7290-LM1]
MTNLILVVDDNDLIRMQLCDLMQEAGYQVAEASNGSEALAAYTRLQPEIVLIDAIMPVMDGFTCCTELQKLPGGANTPILMITALYDQTSVERAFAAGASDYITKPIQWEVLRQRVSRLVKASLHVKALRQQTEQAQLREAQLRMALDAARMGTWDWDVLSNQITWSDNLEVLFGLEPGSFESTYAAFIECVHPEDRNFISRSVIQAIREEAEYDIEYRFVACDGSLRWAASKGVVFRDSSGMAVRMSGVTIDITKRKQAEESLELYANRQALVAELSQSALAGTNLTTLMNSAVTLIAQSLKVEYCKVLELLPDGKAVLLRAGVGWQPGLVGKATVSSSIDSQAGYTLLSAEPVIINDLRTETRFNEPNLLHDHQVVSGMSVIIQGKERPFGVLGAHTTQARNFNRDEVYFLQAVANILATAIDRQKIEDALRESEQRWQLAVQGTNDGIWDWNIKTNQMFVSTRWKEMLGFEQQEISNYLDEWSTRVHPDDIVRVRQLIQDHFAKRIPFYISEHRMRCKHNAYKWILDRGQAQWDEDGNVIRMVGSYTDITERKLAEEQLRQSEERFQIVVRATNDVVWDWDLLKNQVWWNQNVQALGYSTEYISLDTRWWQEHIHPEDRLRVVSNINTATKSGKQFWSNEYRFLRSNNTYADILDRGYVVYDNTRKAVRMIGAMMDMSDRKRVEEELVKQNMRSQLFSDVTVKIRESLDINEVLHTSVTEVQQLLHADRVVIFRLWSDGSGTIVKEAVVPGFPVLQAQNMIDPCFNEHYIEKYRHGRIGSIHDVDKANIDPCYYKMLQSFAAKANLVVPILFKNQLWGLLIAHQCAHPRNWTTWETELLRQLADQIGIAVSQAQLLEQETRQRQELARSNDELQQFAFIASHDLQEPLRKIKTFGDRLKATCGDAFTAQGRDYLERMQNAAQRMQSLIEDLLTLSRVTTRAQPFVSVNLAQVTQEVLSDLEVTIQQSGACVEVGEFATVTADPLQMRQLLQNLIGNALKFHRPEEVPFVKIYTEASRAINGSEFCHIVVEDRGIGFDEKYIDRIFNVFQRLHGRSEYDGTGIGLAICRKIAERHNGSITAQSQPGHGAKFIVTLPM